MSDIAKRLFDGVFAECELEEALSEAEVPYERVGWDHYDFSLELYGVPANYRLPEEVQQQISGMGFLKVYVNHTDKWETHYSFAKGKDTAKGWRVSYPHKRGEEGGSIWVEKHIPGWPQDWFDSGGVIIKAPKEEG